MYHTTVACPTEDQRHLCAKPCDSLVWYPSFLSQEWLKICKWMNHVHGGVHKTLMKSSQCLQEHLHQKWPSIYCLNCKLIECLWILADNSWVWADYMWCSSPDQEAHTVPHCWNEKKWIPNIHTYIFFEALPGFVCLHVWLIEGET